jgi:hypothetical protein
MIRARILARFPDQIGKLIDDSSSAEPVSWNIDAEAKWRVHQVPLLWMPQL